MSGSSASSTSLEVNTSSVTGQHAAKQRYPTSSRYHRTKTSLGPASVELELHAAVGEGRHWGKGEPQPASGILRDWGRRVKRPFRGQFDMLLVVFRPSRLLPTTDHGGRLRHCPSSRRWPTPGGAFFTKPSVSPHGLALRQSTTMSGRPRILRPPGRSQQRCEPKQTEQISRTRLIMSLDGYKARRNSPGSVSFFPPQQTNQQQLQPRVTRFVLREPSFSSGLSHLVTLYQENQQSCASLPFSPLAWATLPLLSRTAPSPGPRAPLRRLLPLLGPAMAALASPAALETSSSTAASLPAMASPPSASWPPTRT